MPKWDIQFNSKSQGSDQDRVTVVANTAIFNAQADWRIAPAAPTSGGGVGTPKGPARIVGCGGAPCNGSMPSI
jgi:hypothetical protein